jgi:AraC family transcriptional regulator
MLTYSVDFNASGAGYDELALSDFDPRTRQRAMLLRIDSRFNDGGAPRTDQATRLHDCKNRDVGAVEIIPAQSASRRAIAWDGIRFEIIQCDKRNKLEFRFRAPCHLLVVYEEGVRDEGETIVGDLPRSTLRALRGKLTFVPAGQEFLEWQRPRARSRVICFYFDPNKMPIHPDTSPTATLFAPRLFFENNMMWETAVELAKAIEDASEPDRYCEALGVMVARELVRIHCNVRRSGQPARGGLAVWQQRIVAAYIEEHLAQPIPLVALAKLVHLSSYYFCRAFRQSFGVPPHRYHLNRRIERAKVLLSDPIQSVTDIALALGFSETSSFSTAFRRGTGATPTEYRRAL